MTADGIDGRRARSESRRAQLISATQRVLATRGAAGLTYRAIAAEAGGSVASIIYHFGSIDELFVTALTAAHEELRAYLAHEDDRSLTRLAQIVTSWDTDRREQQIAEYELYMVAARRPEFAEQAVAWLDLLCDHFAPTLEGAERIAFRALVEGLSLHALLQPDQLTPAAAEAALRAALPALG